VQAFFAEHKQMRSQNAWRGVLVGAVAGLVGTIVMTQAQRALSSLMPAKKGSADNATVKTAGALSRAVTGHGIAADQKNTAGNIVHYTFGTAAGAAYGWIAEMQPAASSALGLPFGAALWAAADEAAVPALGLSGSPAEYPISVHAMGLASHLVYGASTELVRRGLNRWIIC
jgi:putative membrane protein